jgi:hypothetical protein
MNSIGFQVVYPDAPEGEYGSIDEPSPYIHLGKRFQESMTGLQNPDEVVLNTGEITVKFSYPLRTSHNIQLKSSHTDHFTRADLATAIAGKYKEIYREERRSVGKWGIWGHCLDDLVLHTVSLRNGVYMLGIDS